MSAAGIDPVMYGEMPLPLVDRRSTPRAALGFMSVLSHEGTLADMRLCLRVAQQLVKGVAPAPATDAARALASLDAFAEDQLAEPSKRVYAAWHRSLPDRRMWSSPMEVADSLGGWARVPRVRAGTLKPRARRRRRRANGPVFRDEELSRAAQLFARDTPDAWFSPDSYIAWAKKYYDDGCPDGVRVPRSTSPFRRIARRWIKVMAWAGIHLDIKAAHGGGVTRYTDETIYAALGWCRQQTGQLPLRSVYETWYGDKQRRGEARGSPAPQTVASRFQTFPRALAAAGLISQDEAARLEASFDSREVSLAELTIAPALALQARGRKLTPRIYRDWLRDQGEDWACGLIPGPRLRPPSPETLSSRLGGWPTVKFLATILVDCRMNLDRVLPITEAAVEEARGPHWRRPRAAV